MWKKSAACDHELNDEQWTRLQSYGIPQDTRPGSLLFRSGDSSSDLILVDSGEVDVVRGETSDAPEAVVARHGPGRFVGELSLLTGQAAYLGARVCEAGQVPDLVVISAGPAGLAAAVYGASEGLQATQYEDEAQELLRRQVERTHHGARAVVLARNNSADRLEPTTSLVELDVLRAAP